MPLDQRRKTRRFGKDSGGATAVEFAIVAAPLVAIFLAALQTAIIFFFDEALQSVAEKSARQLMTGSAQIAGLTQSQFASVVCANATNVFQCSNLMIDVQSASSFSSISTAPIALTYNGSGAVTNTWNYSPGSAGDIVILRVMYNWPVIGAPLGLNLANQSNGDRLLIATAVFKTEPYQ